MAETALHLSLRFDWQMPVSVRFGTGAALAVAEALGPQHAVALVYAGSMEHDAPAKLFAALGQQLSHVVEVPDGLSSVALARRLSGEVWPKLAAQTDGVLLAVGGGSVLDLAKLLRCRPSDGNFDRIASALRGQARWPEMRLERLWLLPTTSGTGSEVTRWATLWDTDGDPPLKRSFDEPFGFAERAFVDPDFAWTCPASVVRDSALDALAHALEALWNRHANPLSDALALRAARRVVKCLPAALAEPDDRCLRQDLSLAALEAGLAFAQTRTALAHALSYALTLESGMPHGRACAVWLPTAWRLAVGHDRHLDARLAQVFDVPAMHGAACLTAWLREVGVDPRPELHAADADQRIAAALGSARGRNFIGSLPPHHPVG